MTYDVFISYSRWDIEAAREIQRACRRLGRKWNQTRALQVFFDTQDVPAGQPLSPTLEAAARNSRYLILVASTRSAASPWVDQEVAAFLDSAPDAVDRLLIASLDARLDWVESQGRFDPETTDLPPSALAALRTEPTRVELRLDGDEGPVDIETPAGRQALVALVAPAHGLTPMELYSDDSRALTVRRRVAQAAAVTFAILALLAAWQARNAVAQRRVADIRAQSQEALAELDREPAIALSLAGSSSDPRPLSFLERVLLLGEDPGDPPPVEVLDALVRIRADLNQPGPRIRASFPIGDGPILAVDGDPATGRFLTGDFEGKVHYWASSGVSALADVELPARIVDLAFLDPGRSAVAVGTDLERTRLFLLDLTGAEDGRLEAREIETELDGFIAAVAPNSDGSQFLVVVSDAVECPDSTGCGKVYRFDQRGRSMGPPVVTDRSPGLSHAAWTHDDGGIVLSVGDALDFADAATRQLAIWEPDLDAVTQELVGHLFAVEVVGVDPRGRYLVTVAGGPYYEPEIYLWPTDRLDQPLRLANAGVYSVSDISISPDGDRLAMSTAGESSTVALWEITGDSRALEARGPTALPVGAGGALDLAFVSSRELVVGNAEGSVRIVDLDVTGQPLGPQFRSGTSGRPTLAYSWRRELVAVADGTEIQLWDADRGVLVGAVDLGTGDLGAAEGAVQLLVGSLAFGGPGDDRLVVARVPKLDTSFEGGQLELLATLLATLQTEVTVIDVADPSAPSVARPPDEVRGVVTSLAVSPDGDHIALSVLAQTMASRLLVLDTASGDRLDLDELAPEAGAATTVAFVPRSGRLVIGGEDGSVREVVVPSGRLWRRLETGTDARIDVIASSFRGDTLVAATQQGEILLWRAGRWAEPPETARRQQPKSLAVSTDGSQVALVTSNGLEHYLELFDVRDRIRLIGRRLPLREVLVQDNQLIDLEATQYGFGRLEEVADLTGLTVEEAEDLLVRSGRSPGQLVEALEQAGIVDAVREGKSIEQLEEDVGYPLVALLDLLIRASAPNGSTFAVPFPTAIAFDRSATPNILVPQSTGGFTRVDVLQAEAACRLARDSMTVPQVERLEPLPSCLRDGLDR